jgi:peptide/nickel transport system permease protein
VSSVGSREDRRPSLPARMARRPLALFGLVIILLAVAGALAAPLLALYDPHARMFEGLTLQGAPMPPGGPFPLGTDLLGRDLLSRLLYGARTSLVIGIVANGAAVMLGALVGITAGFFRGWIGAILMRFTDLMMAFPALLLAIVLAAIFEPSLWIITMVIAMVNWVQVARVIYSETSALAERDFIEAERALGASTERILARHILPHAVPTIVVWATLGISTTVAALRRGRPADQALMVTSLVFVSAPQFVVGILLLYVFAVQLGWFPIGGYGRAEHVVLPALTLGLLGAGWYSRRLRSSMLGVLSQDFVRTARANGLARRRILLRHVLPNAILSIVAMIGIDIGIFMSRIVVVESVFGWPGIGQLAWQAIQRVDIPIIMGVTLVLAVFIVLGNLLADLIAPMIDPRIKLR